MLGENPIFTWKNKATQEKEQKEYEQWAFPYGEKQRENLIALLLSVYPKETEVTTLVPFLTCRELYETVLEKTGSSDEVINRLINTLKAYKKVIRKKDMTTYIALVLANAEIDGRCQYPSADEIHAKAAELEKLRE